jgi:hypothetical protein
MAADPRHLYELLDDYEIDELLSLVTLEEIADAWCTFQLRSDLGEIDDEDPAWWPIQLLVDS